jgi:hypothetical protein
VEQLEGASLRHAPEVMSVSLHFIDQGMDHNLGLSDAQDVAEYLKRDATKRATSLPYKIVRDEIVGR